METNVRIAGSAQIGPCPECGPVSWVRVERDAIVHTSGVCPWVVTAHDLASYEHGYEPGQEGPWVTDLRHPDGSDGSGGYGVPEWWQGLAFVHAIGGKVLHELPLEQARRQWRLDGVRGDEPVIVADE